MEKCKFCDMEISEKATICPHCQSKVKKDASLRQIIISIFIGTLVLASLGSVSAAFGTLIFFSLLLWIIGLFSPKLFKKYIGNYATRKYISLGFGILILVFSIAIGVFGGGSNTQQINYNNQPTEIKKEPLYEACIASEQRMKEILKAPSTAKFPSCSTAAFSKVEGEAYVFESYVDSQNSFGAMIRTKFACVYTLLLKKQYNIECGIIEE